jgi:sugar phosphate isomerase/epimerase
MEGKMRPTLTGFLDIGDTTTFEEQITLATKLAIRQIALRADGPKPLVEVSPERFAHLSSALKKARIKVSLVDPLVPPSALDDTKGHEIALKTFSYVLRQTALLKPTHILLPLPEHGDVIKEFDAVKAWIDPFIAQAQGSKILLKPQGKTKANSLAYVMKKMGSKLAGVVFDPVHIVSLRESTTTAYRLLRKDIVAMMAVDANTHGTTKLIGYGQTEILSVFKKLFRDKYAGYLVVENRFDLDQAPDKEETKGFFQKLFSNEKKRKASLMRELSHKIFPDGDSQRDISDEEILSNQVKVITKLFID